MRRCKFISSRLQTETETFAVENTSLPLEMFPGKRSVLRKHGPVRIVLSKRKGIYILFALLEAIASRGGNVADFPGDFLLKGKGEACERERARARACSRKHVQAGVADQLNMATVAGCGACACARPPCAVKGSATIGKGSPEKGKTGIASGPSDSEKEPAGEQKEATSAWRTVCVVRAIERQTPRRV